LRDARLHGALLEGPTGDTCLDVRSGIVHWEVQPLERSRRGLDERLLMAAPWLRRLVTALVFRRPTGSALRRALVTRTLLVATAAINRGDYESMSSLLHPDVELYMLPDNPARATGLNPVYRDPAGYVRALDEWREAFRAHRFELREIFDPGSNRFGGRIEEFARGLESGVEVGQPSFYVWEVENAVLRRQWILWSKDTMRELLREGLPAT
jgi:hypothetical protein